ncbi:MAG: hypothetical protein RBS02_13700 [Steroidobacteraceae bacterium]|nr:hypothetical protein [Steroidobacteraceae bacterium]
MNKAVLLLTAMSAILGLTTLHLVRELRAERAQAQELHMRIAELERAREIPSPFRAASPDLQPSPPALSAAPKPATASLGPPAATPAAAPGPSLEERLHMMRRRMEQQRALLRDPEYRAALITQHKAMFGTMYPELSTELELDAEQSDRLATLLAEQQLRRQESSSIVALGEPPDPEQMKALQERAEQERRMADAEIRELLGEEKWSAWKQYQSTMGERHQTTQLRTEFANRGLPLREDQIKPLQQALAESRRRMMETLDAAAHDARIAVSGAPVPFTSTGPAPQLEQERQEEILRRQAEENERLRMTLSGVLTPEQLQYFQERQAAQLKLQDAQMRMMRAQAEARARGEIEAAPGVFFAVESAISE